MGAAGTGTEGRVCTQACTTRDQCSLVTQGARAQRGARLGPACGVRRRAGRAGSTGAMRSPGWWHRQGCSPPRSAQPCQGACPGQCPSALSGTWSPYHCQQSSGGKGQGAGGQGRGGRAHDEPAAKRSTPYTPCNPKRGTNVGWGCACGCACGGVGRGGAGPVHSRQTTLTHAHGPAVCKENTRGPCQWSHPTRPLDRSLPPCPLPQSHTHTHHEPHTRTMSHVHAP